jgi:glycosyltransferase involved in cell wall biosynthesis
LSILEIFLVVVAVAWIVLGIRVIVGVVTMRPMPALAPPPSGAPGDPPTVSVIIAVRDEGARIEKTVRQVMGQEGVRLELIVADDRSTDETPAILARLAQEFAALRVIRIDELPANWLGKCHAMHVASQRASGEWLVFTDGDVWMRPETVARAVSAARASGAGHVTLTPDFAAAERLSVTFKSSMLVFMVLFNLEMSRANRDKRNAMCGVGAFNLVRRDVYRAFGGHQALRLEIADDLKMGLLVGRAGHRSRAFLGHELIQADWASDVRGLLKALQKNAFVGLNYSVTRLVMITAMFMCMWLGGLLGAFTNTWAGYAATGAMGPFVAGAVMQARKLRWPIGAALLVPFTVVVIIAVFWNSAITVLRQGGVRWRDTFYPLALLRANLITTGKSGPFSV